MGSWGFDKREVLSLQGIVDQEQDEDKEERLHG
jgi:hypothetical protein